MSPDPLNQIEKNDLAAEQLGRKPFWEKTFHLGKDYRGGVCDAQLRAYKLMPNSEGQEIRLEKRGLRNGKPVAIQMIHLTEDDLKGILAMYEELEDGR